MPKTKKETINKEETVSEMKEIILDDEEKVIDPELIAGEPLIDEEDEEGDDAVLDDDEVDPFKDKWEE